MNSYDRPHHRTDREGGQDVSEYIAIVTSYVTIKADNIVAAQDHAKKFRLTGLRASSKAAPSKRSRWNTSSKHNETSTVIIRISP